ncbi:MAG: GNAT family N-acetyltransferase [Deltaproteobacteria bacterium]
MKKVPSGVSGIAGSERTTSASVTLTRGEMQTNGSWADISLEGIQSSLRAEVTEAITSWFATPDFCEYYSPEPANRLRFYRSPNGRIEHAFCYRNIAEGKRMIFGPLQLPFATILGLPASLDCREVTLIRMTDVPAEIASTARWRVSVRITSNDFLLKLPAIPFEYLQSLGLQMQKQLPNYLRRVQREWGARFRICFLRNEEIELVDFTSLVELNQLRMESKGTHSLWTSKLVHQRWLLSKRCGLICGLYNGERLVGGTLNYLHKRDAYMFLIGHDPEFDRFRLGKLALWLTTNHLIQSGVEQYHLLWGQALYKEQFGALRLDLKEVVVFDGRLAAFCWHMAECAKMTRFELIRFSRRLVNGVRRRLTFPSKTHDA